MGTWLTIIFIVLGLLSTWMTAKALFLLGSRRQEEEDMNNLFEQVFGSVKSGDLPRAILILEGEPGPMAKLLSSMLTEATKFTPKLRVAYKVTLESMKRRDQVNMNPLRLVRFTAPVVGIFSFLGPIISLGSESHPLWTHALLLFVLGLVIGAISAVTLTMAERQSAKINDFAGVLGRKLLTYLLGPESPLSSIRGKSFPEPE